MRAQARILALVCLLLGPDVTAAPQAEKPWFRDATKEYDPIGIGPAAFADPDGDGFLDMVSGGKVWTNTLGRHPTLGKSRFLKVRLEGSGKCNRLGIGSRVVVQVGNQTFTRQVEAGTGIGSQNDLTLHFGVGLAGGPAEVTVWWAGGGRSTHRAELNRTVVLRKAK